MRIFVSKFRYFVFAVLLIAAARYLLISLLGMLFILLLLFHISSSARYSQAIYNKIRKLNIQLKYMPASRKDKSTTFTQRLEREGKGLFRVPGHTFLA
jgi:hypothetical protein